MHTHRRPIKAVLLFLIVALMVASCAPAATPTEPPPTEAVSAAPTEAPTEAPAATPTVYGGAEQPVESNWWDGFPLPSWGELKRVTLSPETSWFQVYEVLPDIYAILEPDNWQQVISYLIIGPEKAMLFDTGMNVGNIKQVVDELTDLPVFVLNSHAHPDHVAGNYQFEEIWGVDNEWAKTQAEGIANEALADFWMVESFRNNEYPAGFDAAGYVIKPYTVTHFVEEGEKIDMGNRLLEVIFTPGHSPDGIALIDRENRLLWVEDVFYTGPLYAFLTESNLDDYVATAAKLGDIVGDVDYLLPSHSETYMPSIWLTKMDEAFQAIKNGTTTDFSDESGLREYMFEGFTILLPIP